MSKTDIVNQIITNARLYGAVVHAWNTSIFQVKDNWKPGDSHKLPLIKMYPSGATAYDGCDGLAYRPTYDFYCYASYDRQQLNHSWGHRILITAPHIDPTFKYVAKWWEVRI